MLGRHAPAGRLGFNWGAHATTSPATTSGTWSAGARLPNTGPKNEPNTFPKATWDTGRRGLGDAQVRPALPLPGRPPLGSVTGRSSTRRPGCGSTLASVGLYASVGRTSREPARSDMLAGEDNATCPTTCAREAGTGGRRRGGSRGPARRPTARATLRHGVRDEIALTGELSEIGLPVRRNVGRSSRRGVELDLAWRPRRAGASRRRPRSAGTGSRPGRSSTTCTTRTAPGSRATPRVHPDVAPL